MRICMECHELYGWRFAPKNEAMDYKEIYNRNRVTWLYEAARSPHLNATAVRVGLLFATFVQPEDREEVSPSYEWLMQNAQIKNRSTLSSALQQLEAAKFLNIERFHRYRNHYSLPFNGDEIWKR